MSVVTPSPEQTLRGIGLCALAFGLFSIQDAIVKWLVASYAVPQVLFARSVIIVIIACLLNGRAGPAALLRSRHKLSLLLRAILILMAWVLYYSAARDLGLAELTTLYFAAPIVVVGLSVLILGERVGGARWLIVLSGFGGVLLAATPSASVSIAPAAMALMAAFCWALSSILIRMISRTETTANQMLTSNGLFVVVCGLALPWIWQTPDLFSGLLLVALGVAGGLGQYLIIEAFRHAPASALAPVEYLGLVWAFALGFLIWGDVPSLSVFGGAAIIVASSLALVWCERQSQRLRRSGA